MNKSSGLLLLIFMSACQHKNPVKELQLIRAYEVQTQNKYEPSGLTLWDGEFYTVSDKHNTIFHLQFNQDSIHMEPIIQISGDELNYFDFEGITHDDAYFYLISERTFKILKVSKDGSQQSWMPTTHVLKKAGQEVGLFQKQNAFFESLCYLSNNRFLLTAERDPRGFVEATFDQGTIEKIDAYLSNDSNFDSAKNRSTDFTGLSCDEDIYVLERNAYIVSKLRKHNNKFKESQGWSYQHIIERPKFLYQDMQFGHAEGLVVKGDKVYIILDNNKNPHKNNSKNNNSLFLELQM